MHAFRGGKRNICNRLTFSFGARDNKKSDLSGVCRTRAAVRLTEISLGTSSESTDCARCSASCAMSRNHRDTRTVAHSSITLKSDAKSVTATSVGRHAMRDTAVVCTPRFVFGARDIAGRERKAERKQDFFGASERTTSFLLAVPCGFDALLRALRCALSDFLIGPTNQPQPKPSNGRIAVLDLRHNRLMDGVIHKLRLPRAVGIDNQHTHTEKPTLSLPHTHTFTQETRSAISVRVSHKTALRQIFTVRQKHKTERVKAATAAHGGARRRTAAHGGARWTAGTCPGARRAHGQGARGLHPSPWRF